MRFGHLEPDPSTLRIPLNDENRTSTNFMLDKHIERFIRRRLTTKYIIAEGKTYRQRGYIEQLAKEANGFATKCDLEQPTGLYFIPRIVEQMNRDSARVKAHSELKYKLNKARKANPVKRAQDQETTHLYNVSQRAKDKQREHQKRYAMQKLGIPKPIVPHIDSLKEYSPTIQGFITNHKKRDCNSITLQQLMKRPLVDSVVVDADGAHTRNHEKLYRIAAYSIQKQQWILMKNITTRGRIEWDSITFAKGAYVGYAPGEGARLSKKLVYDEIANHAESEEHLHLSVPEAQQKLRDFIGDSICIDYGGCDNHCLRGWNDNLFGIDRMDQ